MTHFTLGKHFNKPRESQNNGGLAGWSCQHIQSDAA